jgi:hypothetical protein
MHDPDIGSPRTDLQLERSAAAFLPSEDRLLRVSKVGLTGSEFQG